LAARFKTSDGRTVVVHSTAPLRIDGLRRTLPPDVRYAVMPTIVNKPASPRGVVAFRPAPVAFRPISGRSIGSWRYSPATTMPAPVRPVVVGPRPVAPIVTSPGQMPIYGPVLIPLPVQPVAPRPLPPPTISLPQLPPRPISVPMPKATPHA
jgi:hypothetical protein